MWELKQAKNYYKGRKGNRRMCIGIHDMETPEDVKRAENVAAWMAGDNAPLASVHFLCDPDSTVQGVKCGDTAWGAKGGNHDFVHIEHVGYARQSRNEWLDNPSVLTMNQSSLVAAEVVTVLRRFGVDFKVRRLNDAEIVGGTVSGFAGHVDISRAMLIRGGHTDPGEHFPYDVWIPKVQWWLSVCQNKTRFDFV